jgi:hypothetical protein
VRTRRLTCFAALAATVVLAAGCAAQTNTDAASATGGSASSSAAAAETTASSAPATADPDDAASVSPFSGDTEADVADPAAPEGLTLTAVRTGRHEGFDRVVFEVDGTGTPGWDVRYVDDPCSQGSGDPIDVEGAAALQVTLTGVGLPDDTGVPEYSGPDPLSIPETETVTEIVFDGTFEGQAVAFVGTTAQTPFRVYLLEDPGRVVVEVADEG